MLTHPLNTDVPQETSHFPRIAVQLRAGVPAPRVRDQLMQDHDLSRLRAGKLVEDVQKSVRRAKLNMISGAFMWVIGASMLYFVGFGLLFFILFVGGGTQFAAGHRTMKQYNDATYDPAPSTPPPLPPQSTVPS